MSTMTVSSIAHCEDCESNTALDIHGRCGKCGSEAVTRRTAMANLRQQIAASESLRSKFLHGKPFSEEDVRMELAPSADLRKQLDEAMQLVLALTAANKRLRAQIKGHEFSFSSDGSSYVHNDDCELCAIEETK